MSATKLTDTTDKKPEANIVSSAASMQSVALNDDNASSIQKQSEFNLTSKSDEEDNDDIDNMDDYGNSDDDLIIPQTAQAKG